MKISEWPRDGGQASPNKKVSSLREKKPK